MSKKISKEQKSTRAIENLAEAINHVRDDEQQLHKAIYSVSIELSHDYQNQFSGRQGTHLSPGCVYSFGNESKVSYDTIRDFVVGVLVADVSRVCEMHINAPVEIKVSGEYDGSLVIVFSAIFGAVQLISGIKDIYDVAQLIRDLANERIEKRLSKEYGQYFYVNVIQRLPGRDFKHYIDKKAYMGDQGKIDLAIKRDETIPKRDAFFWYLFGINIVLFAIIVLLTINALRIAYW